MKIAVFINYISNESKLSFGYNYINTNELRNFSVYHAAIVRCSLPVVIALLFFGEIIVYSSLLHGIFRC